MALSTTAYVYDDFLGDRKFERPLIDLEQKLTSLNINGHIARLALFRNARDLVTSLMSKGVTTVVIVGNDQTLDKMMWFLPDLELTIGYIPMSEPSQIGHMMGIPTGVGAVDVVAARFIETFDVGTIDERYFLSEVALPATIATVDIEGMYRLSTIHGGSISIRNIGGYDAEGIHHADPKDGLLDVVITPQLDAKPSRWKKEKSENTHTYIKNGKIVSPQPVDVRVDGHVLNGFEFRLGIIPNKLRFITNRIKNLGETVPKV